MVCIFGGIRQYKATSWPAATDTSAFERQIDLGSVFNMTFGAGNRRLASIGLLAGLAVAFPAKAAIEIITVRFINLINLLSGFNRLFQVGLFQDNDRCLGCPSSLPPEATVVR